VQLFDGNRLIAGGSLSARIYQDWPMNTARRNEILERAVGDDVVPAGEQLTSAAPPRRGMRLLAFAAS